MLQEFLTNNLIEITDDANVGKLKKACSVLEKKLLKNKQKITTLTLIALDPEIPATNPDVMEVQQLIIGRWKTFTANSKDTPLTYIRAVILEVLENLSKDLNIANQIWLTGRNIQKHYKLIGKEKELITNFLLNLGNEIETKATENWSLTSESKLQKLSIELKSLTGVTIDKTELENHLKAASIHSGLGNGGANPQYPSNNGITWPVFFSERASQGITDVINKALKNQAKEIIINQTQIQEAINKLLSQTQTEILEKNSSLQMRTQLLWWKEACYSSSIMQSYRGQQNGLLQLILAKDYSYFVPEIFPASIDYFLKEMHRTLLVEDDKKLKMSEILSLIEQSKDQLKSIFAEITREEERLSLFNFINGFVWNKYKANQFKNLVGFSESTEIFLSDFTLWLFHDLQSLKTLNNK